MNKNNNPGVATSFALLITMLASFAFADGADWESQPIGELVDALSAMTGGQDQQLALQKVIVRKKEALPVVTGKLQSGAWFEKHMMTKLLRCSPWLETRVELECLAASETDHWLAREGAVYALAELGDASAGPAILAVLNGPETPLSVQRVAVAALARIGYTAALADLSLLTQHEDVRMRLFANRALAELGGTADKAFLLSCLGDGDFTVREDACGALAMVAGEDVAMALADRAAGDVNSAVRDAAAQALRDAAGAGISKLWLQQGAQSVETAKTARDLGLDPITGKCILMYAGEVKSIHGFHKFINKVLGQYG